MAKPRGIALVATLCAAAFAIASPSALSSQPSSAWIDEAVSLASAGRWADAEALLDSFVELQPGNPDLLYLRALARAMGGRPLGGALEDLAAARSGSPFSRYSDRDAALLQAQILVRERRWREALDSLATSPVAAPDPAVSLVRARALAGLGDTSAFLDLLGTSMERFPEDSAFPRLFLSRAGRVPATEAERALGEAIVRRARSYAEIDPELPVLAAPLMAYRSDRENAVRAFRAMGGRSPTATLRALEYGIIDEDQSVAELLGAAPSIRLRDLEELFGLLRTPLARKSAESALARWSGSVEVDRDQDSIAEEGFELERGLVSSWRLDADQDGAFEVAAVFAEGLPSSVTILAPGLSVGLRYGTYPAVGSARFSPAGAESRTYDFGPGAFAYAPALMRRFAGEGRDALFFPEPADVDPPSELSCAAVALRVRSERGEASADSREIPAPGGSYSIATLERGVAAFSRTFRDGRLYSTAEFERGALSVERVDEDGDGRFETERHFDTAQGSGVLAWARVDTDGDGVFDYREQATFPFRKEWDYDGNGTIDAAQYLLPDGATRGDFSSRLDGRLDESVVVKEGRVTGLTRDGAALRLTPDANPTVTWIGRKPFDLGSNLPAGEGFFKHMEKRYRLVRVGGRFFAELVP